eukprot:c16237_g1_i3.p1 GENE.c16237_g1_i3~~c16237_g1_i3.p1  ORF type:complete len:218 (+),score=19.78 c16237_g1_i3:328-981(+)
MLAFICRTQGSGSLEELVEFFAELPHPNKVFVAGNHDLVVEKAGKEATRTALASVNAIYLENECAQVGQIKFWGSPSSAKSPSANSSFQQPREERIALRETIPPDTHIVVSHGRLLQRWTSSRMQTHTTGHEDHACPFRVSEEPPANLEPAQLHYCAPAKRKVGQPLAHFFGHIHENYGVYADTTEARVDVNAAVCNVAYQAVNGAVVLDFPVSMFQ